MKYILSFFICFLYLNLPAQDLGQEPFGKSKLFLKDSKKDSKKVSMEALWSLNKFSPGDQVYLGLKLKIPDGLHIYPPAELVSSEPDLSIFPSKITFSGLPKGVLAGETVFPKPIRKFYAILEQEIPFYEKSVNVLVPIQINKEYQENEISFSVSFLYQMCDDQVCEMPTTITEKVTLIRTEAGSVAGESIDPIFINIKSNAATPTNEVLEFKFFDMSLSVNSSGVQGVFIICLMTLLGGFLLNFTPCVLPVIPLKIMSLTNTAKSRQRSIYLGIVMFVGVVSFWMLIGFLIVFSTQFTAVNKLFQYQWFPILIGLIILIMSIGMMGLFELKLPQKIQSFSPNFNSVGGSFGIGVMTAVLSTPCTAPFMGTASAWSLGKPPFVTLFIFALTGTGMGLPYLVLSIFPQLVKWMPRGGDGTLVLKKILGIFMLAASIFFLGIGLNTLLNVKEEPWVSLYWWPVFGVSAFGGLYLIIKVFQIAKSNTTKYGFGLLGIVIIFLSGYLLFSMTSASRSEPGVELDWTVYTKEGLENAKKEGRPILLDFTAEWCLNCKALEKAVLSTAGAKKLFDEKKVILIKVDITKENADANDLLKKEGSITIPYLVLYGSDGEAVFRGDSYTLDVLKKHLK